MIGHFARNIRSPSVRPQRKVGMKSVVALLSARSIVKRLYSATQNSVRGLVDGFRTEPALRDEAVLVAIGLPLGLVIAPSGAWYAAMIGTLLIVLAVEFLNTGIEKLADHVTPEQHSEIRRIKDFGSAAVFCSLSLAGLVWLVALAVRCGLLG
jgi:diacylglycerol kinase (ATP)